MDIPGSATQFLIALGFVVPGSVYQAVRQRLRGPAPDDLNFSNKLFRALGVSAALNALYLAFAGKHLLRLVVARQDKSPSWQGAEQHVVALGWLVLVLFFALPALLAAADYMRATRSFTSAERFTTLPLGHGTSRSETWTRVSCAYSPPMGYGWVAGLARTLSFPATQNLVRCSSKSLMKWSRMELSATRSHGALACMSGAMTFAPSNSSDNHYHRMHRRRKARMADSKGKKSWVAPRSGGYAARSVKTDQFAGKSSSASELSQKKDKTPPPGRGSAAKAK